MSENYIKLLEEIEKFNFSKEKLEEILIAVLSEYYDDNYDDMLGYLEDIKEID